MPTAPARRVRHDGAGAAGRAGGQAAGGGPTSATAGTQRSTAPAPTTLWRLGTGLAAGVLLVAAVPNAAAVYDVPLLTAFLAATAQCLALPLALTRPRLATVVQYAAAALIALSADLTPGSTWPLPVAGILVLVAHVAVVGLRHHWTVAVAVWWTSAALCIALVVVDPLTRGDEVAGPTLVVYTTTSAFALVVALFLRQRGRIRAELQLVRRDVELEQSRLALAEERTRIARELHDVVAHSMSVIHMQASSAPYRHPDLDPRATEELRQIALAARTATREMRQILHVLRAEDADVDLRPAPGLAQVPDLVAGAAGAGTPTELDLGDLRADDVPDPVGVVVYRIVQEALSNAVRHAPGAAARVTLRREPADGRLLVAVSNAPATDGLRSHEGVDDAGRRAHLGLVGIAERVSLLGGTVQHGPTDDGGFHVVARLPLDGSAAPVAGTTP